MTPFSDELARLLPNFFLIGAGARDPRAAMAPAGRAGPGGAVARPLGDAGGRNAVAEANRPDFRHLLANCSVLVLQAGYDMRSDMLAMRTRAVVVPFSAEWEAEDALRADRLARPGVFPVVMESELAPATMAAGAAGVAALPRSPAGAVDLAGADRTAKLHDPWAGLDHADMARAQ